MRRTALLVLLPCLLLLSACGDGSLVPAAGELTYEAVAPPATSPSTSPSTAPTPSPAPATPVPELTPSPSTTTAAPAPSPAPVPTTGASTALASARADVARAAPVLEAYFQDREYPLDLAQARSTLADAGVRLGAGNTLGGYDYDGDAVEFVLCVQNASGAFATYDTAPMTVARSGETGGCPG